MFPSTKFQGGWPNFEGWKVMCPEMDIGFVLYLSTIVFFFLNFTSVIEKLLDHLFSNRVEGS